MITIFKKWLQKKKLNAMLDYERTEFSFSESAITATDPLKEVKQIQLDDLIEIGIKTNNLGPFIEDVFLIVSTDTDSFSIPQQSSTFKDLTKLFKSYENFNWHNFTEAMCCTENNYFKCWERAPNS